MGTGHNWTTMAQLCSSNIKPNRCDMPVLSAALRCGCKFSGSIPETILFPAGGTLIHRAYAIANCASFQFLTPKKKRVQFFFKRASSCHFPHPSNSVKSTESTATINGCIGVIMACIIAHAKGLSCDIHHPPG